MKKVYLDPMIEWIVLGEKDILTISDNDAPFLPPSGSDDDGWTGYH